MAGRLLRDPLIHFLAAGALLFPIHHLLSPSDTGSAAPAAAPAVEKTIVVDRPALLAFMQYRSAAFQPRFFGAQLAAMPDRDRKELVDSFVREEALVREAHAMGLDTGDYVIRRRLIQKMMYLVDDAATANFAPGDAELERYFRAHQADYQRPPTLTFTHVFVDKEAAHPEGIQRAAGRLKAQLEARHARFEDAPGYGDRVLFLQNYVDRTPDFVESHFGHGFTAALSKLAPSDHWQGPISSDYGYHLVLLTARHAASLPTFAEVREQVKDDLLHDTIARYRETALADLTRRFTVRMKDLPATAESPSKGGGSSALALLP